jgi:mannitol/fructose-specific phosphotransferase system IIA component (Ntr-type)
MPCASDVVVHLRLLAKIFKLLRTTGITKRFMQADNENEVIRILLELERMGINPVEEPRRMQG